MRIAYDYRNSEIAEVHGETWRRYWWLYFFYAATAVASLLMPVWLSGYPDLWWVKPLGVLAGAYMLCSLWASIPQVAAKQTLKHGDGPYEAEIDETGVRTSAPHARMDIQWAGFHRYQETASTFVLFRESVFYMFPKRAFTAEQLTEFRSLVSRKLPTK